MDAIRVSRVEGVLCSKAGRTQQGTVHLTTHHLIVHYDREGLEEMWVPYPLISLVTRMPQTLHGRSPLTVRSRTFETFTMSFQSEKDAIDVFDSIKELTVATSISKLYAFDYAPNPPLSANNGWSLYSPRTEFGRMGVGSRSKAWRFTDINKDYSFCPTYPARLVVPTRISDATLQYASKYRSKCRIPTLTYLHWANYGSITRSSQPMVGLTNNRSIQDEKLIEAIFQTHHSPQSRAPVTPIYGATATNIIVDARPTTNAMANTAKGAGTENMDHYKDAKKAYLGIDHIHTMRESLAKIVEALRETETAATSVSGDLPGESLAVPILDRQALRRSGWLRHIAAILEGTLLIVRNVHVNSSHVLVHCSDGWDRTSQLSSLAQVCLDPFYRTVRGFQVLVEKDWVSFGHKFLDRCGHLSSDKFFVAPVETSGNPSGAEAAQAFFASVQNRFASQNHIKETSPVFHQFLESVRQVQRQFPERFEYNERFLRQLHYHLYSCQFGTFLANSERERREGEGGPPLCNSTISVWDFFNSPPEAELNLNPLYDPSLDDPTRREPGADMGVLMPNPKDVRFWNELYGRTDEEMNGRFVVKPAAQDLESVTPAENAEEEPDTQMAIQSDVRRSISPSPLATPAPLSPQSLARLAMQRAASPSPFGTPLNPPNPAAVMGQRTQNEGQRDYDNSTLGSAYTLKTQGSHIPPRTPSPSQGRSMPRAPPSPRAGANQGPELFSTGAVRSMWGRFSTNASAALSVVQDAYGGVARDMKGLSVGSNTPQDEKGGELKTRDEINTWSGDRPSSPSRNAALAYTISSASNTNPWATTRARPGVSSVLLDNPWSTVQSTPLDARSADAGLSHPLSRSLPADPTVARPERLSNKQNSRSSTLSLLPLDTSAASSPVDAANVSAGLETIPPKAEHDSALQATPPPLDPLGVGML